LGGQGSRGDDRSTVVHVRQAGLNHVEHTHQIGVDGVGPRLDGLAFAHRADACIGHDDVEATQLVDAVGDGLPHSAALANVDDRGVTPHRFLFDQPRRFVEIFRSRKRIRVAL
jgi:hypothetical protein